MRTGFAAVEDAADLPLADAVRSGKRGARDHPVDSNARRSVAGSALAPMMKETAVPGAEHCRKIAVMLRETARWCQFPGARKEILHLAARLESQADHLDRRAGQGR